MFKNLSDKARWGLIITAVVLVVALIVLAVSYFSGTIFSKKSAEDGTDVINEATLYDGNGKPYRVGEDGTISPVQEPTYTPEPHEFNPGGLSWEEFTSLTDEELAAYLNQVEWDDAYQAYVDSDTEEHDDPFYYEKFYMQTHPDYSVPGFGNPYYEDERYVDLPSSKQAEIETNKAEAASSIYNNTPISYVYDDEGNSISFGVEGSDGNGIYLTPYCSESASGLKNVGFVFAYDSGFDRNYDARTEPMLWYENAGYPVNGNYLIIGDSYNDVYPAVYDKDQKIWYYRWIDQLRVSGKVTDEKILHFRAVDLNNGDLITSFCVVIKHDNKSDTYYLADIYDGDVSTTGELSAEERYTVIDDAIYLLRNNDAYSFSGNIDWSSVRERATVEYLGSKTYYSEIINAKMDAKIIASSIGTDDIFVADIPVNGLGFVAVYFTPEREFVYGFDGMRESDGSTTLLAVGVERLLPMEYEENAPLGQLSNRSN